MSTEGYQPRSGRRGCALLLVVLILLGVTMCGPSASDKARWAADRAAMPFQIVSLTPGKKLGSVSWGEAAFVTYFPDGIADFVAAVDGDLAVYRKQRLGDRPAWYMNMTFRLPYEAGRSRAAKTINPATLELGEEVVFARNTLVRRVTNLTPFDAYGQRPAEFSGLGGAKEVFYDPVVDAYYGCIFGSCKAVFVVGPYEAEVSYDDVIDRPIVRRMVADIRRSVPRWQAIAEAAKCSKEAKCK